MSPISDNPTIIASVAPTSPAWSIGAKTKPNAPMATVTQINIARRPFSAILALIGIAMAKKTTPMS